MSSPRPVVGCDCETRLAKLEAAVFSTGENQGKTIGELMRQIWAMPPVVLPPWAGLDPQQPGLKVSDGGNEAQDDFLESLVNAEPLDDPQSDGHVVQIGTELCPQIIEYTGDVISHETPSVDEDPTLPQAPGST